MLEPADAEREVSRGDFHARAIVAFGIAVLTAIVALAIGVGASTAAAAITQPAQPNSGPGGKDYSNRGFTVHAGGRGVDAWFVFQPTKPRPKKAPIAIITHGYFEYTGHSSMDGLIRHTVKTGSIVIYPLWQTAVATPCPGPVNIEPCMTSETKAIRGALAYLRASKKRVQPDVRRASYFGFSFGGVITANLANRYKKLHLPRPRAIFLDDPEDGGIAGVGEPALDDSLSGIPSDTLFQCHSGAEGAIGPILSHSDITSCNAVFPKIGQIPKRNKDLVLTHPDTHGIPTLSSKHGVCAGPGSGFKVDAYDWNFCWKVWDALRSCAYTKRDCRYALGNTPQHRFMGRWSDGVPITPLKIQDAAPIRP